MPLTKRWLFRVSSHLRHGRGHVARCTVLAEEMREKGYNVFFQLDQESIDAATRLKKKGFTCTEKNIQQREKETRHDYSQKSCD